MTKMKLLACLAISTLLLSSCGYSGFYRYPCQDPNNWETPECKPPICTAAGLCPVDLVGEAIFNGTTTQTTPEGGNK